MARIRGWQADFVERVGDLAEMTGLPPSFVRVFAWMIVCEPPEQSASDLRAALDLSAGAVSMATTALVRIGLAERVSVPGERQRYYRFNRAGWERMLRLRVEGAAQMRAIADEAIAAVGTPTPRLVEMRDVYAWFEDLLTPLVAEAPWNKRRSAVRS